MCELLRHLLTGGSLECLGKGMLLPSSHKASSGGGPCDQDMGTAFSHFESTVEGSVEKGIR